MKNYSFNIINKGLSLNKITKSIKKKPIIRNISINVQRGQVIGLSKLNRIVELFGTVFISS